MPQEQKKQIPAPIQIALALLDTFGINDKSIYTDLKQKLPALAMHLDKLGKIVNEGVLKKHITWQDNIPTIQPLNTSPKTHKKNYDEIVKKLKEIYSESHPVIAAAKQGDITKIKELAPIYPDEMHNALLFAAEDGHLDLVKHLVEELNVDPTQDKSKSLVWAASGGHLDIIKYLEKHDVDLTTGRNQTIVTAVVRGYVDIVEYMHEKGLSSNSINNLQVREAAENNHADVLKFLDDNNIANTKDIIDYDLLLNLSNSGALETLEYFKDHTSNLVVTEKNSLLYEAASHGLGAIKFWHQQGGLIDDYTIERTITLGHLDAMKYLHENGGDITFKHNHIIWIGSNNNNIDILEYAIKHGADISKREDALMQACSERNYNAVKFLLENGGDKAIFKSFIKDKDTIENFKKVFKNIDQWKKVHGDYPPSRLEKLSPYYFKPKAFKAAKEILTKEGYKTNIYAYNASAFLGTENRILEYLEKWGKPSKQPLHDITYMIDIPTSGRPDLKAWGDAVLKFGPEMAKLIKFSDRLEKPLSSLNKTRDEVAKFAYTRGEEHPELARLCLKHYIDEDSFDDALNLTQTFNRKSRSVPDILIKGEQFDMNGAKFYKLPESDIRGLFLGEMTDCCQSLGGVGEECAIHGFNSPNSGFYVVEKNNEIIGQTWAWLGKEGELVFDSIETLGSRLNQEQWRKIVKEFALELEQTDSSTTAFNIGSGGATPLLPFNKSSKCAEPKDYDGYRDSHISQYQVWKR